MRPCTGQENAWGVLHSTPTGNARVYHTCKKRLMDPILLNVLRVATADVAADTSGTAAAAPVVDIAGAAADNVANVWAAAFADAAADTAVVAVDAAADTAVVAADAAADIAVVAADARAAALADAAADVAAAVDSAGDLCRRACRVRRHCGLYVFCSARRFCL